jgi:hypothetical protein
LNCNWAIEFSAMRKGLVFMFIVNACLFSCSGNEEFVPDWGLDYFPVRVGAFHVYQVEETTVVQSVEKKSVYELRVTVKDSSINEQGITTYSLLREKRATVSSNWESLDTWSVKLVGNKMIQNEGNVLFVKLFFPLSRDLKWNGNEFNNLPNSGNIFNDRNSEHYTIGNLDVPIALSSGFETDHSLQVVHNSYEDAIIGSDQRIEIYAKGVGLIYKEITQLQYCTANCPVSKRIDKGLIFVQTLKEHGQN